MLLDVANRLLDLYAPVIGASGKIDRALRALRAKVDDEIELQKSMLELLGAMDLVLTAASIRPELDMLEHDQRRLQESKLVHPEVQSLLA
jgi:U3 small nucleolar RNA-associated protein 15